MTSPGERCAGCGATYAAAGDGCDQRFAALLALDHSRQEPWGSRHGIAFSAFVLQHADRYARPVLERAWVMLRQVYGEARDRSRVAQGLRRLERDQAEWRGTPLPAGTPAPPFPVTIADLGTFDADHYAVQLDAWCRATLRHWGFPFDGAARA